MGKQIMVDEETYEKLTQLKKGNLDSFTKVLDSLLAKITPRQQLLKGLSDFEAVIETAVSHNSLEHTTGMFRTLWLQIQKDPECIELVNKELDKLLVKATSRGKKK